MTPVDRSDDAEPRHPFGRDRLGDDDLRRRAVPEMMLQRRVLVVVRRRARDAEAPRRDRQLVRAMREREVETSSLRMALQRAQPSCE